MSVWADIHKRASGLAVRKEDKPEPEIDPFSFTFYDAEENRLRKWTTGADTKSDAEAELEAIWHAHQEEERRKMEKEVAKAKKEQKFLGIWDTCISLSFLISGIFFAIAAVWVCAVSANPPQELLLVMLISGVIFMITGLGDTEDIFTGMRKHVKQYLK